MLQFTFSHISPKTGCEFEIKVPGKRVICEECDGTGRVLVDGLRGHAFSSEEMFEEPGFAEDYFGGKYDTKCDECHGEKVIVGPDESRMTKRQMFLWGHFLARNFNDMMEARHYKQLRNAGIEY